MKKRLLTLTLILVLLGGIALAPRFINWEGYKGAIAATLQQATALDTAVYGTIQVRLLPRPIIRVYGVKIQNPDHAVHKYLLQARRMDIFPSLLDLLKGQVLPESILLYEPEISLEKKYDNGTEWVISPERISQTTSTLKTIQVENGTFYSKGGMATIARGLPMDATIALEKGAIRTIVLSVPILRDIYTIHWERDAATLAWGIESPAFSLSYTGKKNGESYTGSLKGTGKDVAQLLHVLVNGAPFTQPNPAPESFTLDGQLSILDRTFSATSVTLHSTPLEGTMEVKGNLDAAGLLEASVDFNKVNLDTLVLPDQAEDQGNPLDGAPIYDLWRHLSENLTVLAEIHAPSVQYRNTSIEDVSLNLDAFNGELSINPFSAHVGDGTTQITGTWSHNGIRPEFNGSITAEGKNARAFLPLFALADLPIPKEKLGVFSLQGKLHMIPRKLEFQDAKLVVDDTTVEGDLTFQHDNDQPSVRADLMVDTLDLDAYGLSPLVVDGFKHYMLPDGGKGNAVPQTQYYLWLRTNNYNLDAALTFHGLTFNQVNYAQVVGNVSLYPGKLRLDNIAVMGDRGNFGGGLEVDVQGIQPQMTLQLAAHDFNTADFLPNLPTQSKAIDHGWSEAPITLPRFETFNGTIALAFDHFTHGAIEADNVKLAGKLQQGSLVVSTLTGNTDGGGFSITGLLGLGDAPALAASFSLASVDITPLLSILPSSPITEGKVSVAGALKMNGSTLKTWIQRLEGNATIAARNVVLQGIDLKQITGSTSPLAARDAVTQLKQGSAFTGQSYLDALDGTLTLAGGIISLPKLALTTKQVTGVTTGTLNLNDWSLNLKHTLAFNAPAYHGQQAVYVPITQTGTLGNPLQNSVDTSLIERYRANQDLYRR